MPKELMPSEIYVCSINDGNKSGFWDLEEGGTKYTRSNPAPREVTVEEKALDALNWFYYMLDDDGYDDALQDRWNKVTAFNEIRKHLRITKEK